MTAWLIESARGTYFNGRRLDHDGFTADVNDAVRFARFEDAEVVRVYLLASVCEFVRSTEHMWAATQEKLE